MKLTQTVHLILWTAAAVCPAQTIAVHVYDLAGLPAGKWTEAAAKAGQVLAKAGYPVDWIACRGADARPETAARCGGARGANEYILRIMSGKAPQAHGSRQTLAQAHVNSDYATLFLDSIQAQAADLDVSPNTLLACATAHEVVHLLRGPAHSSSGLMKAVWDRHDAAAIEQLHLPLR